MSGINTIGYTEIAAWLKLTDHHLEPHEVTAIIVLDAASRFPGDADVDDESGGMRIDGDW